MTMNVGRACPRYRCHCDHCQPVNPDNAFGLKYVQFKNTGVRTRQTRPRSNVKVLRACDSVGQRHQSGSSLRLTFSFFLILFQNLCRVRRETKMGTGLVRKMLLVSPIFLILLNRADAIGEGVIDLNTMLGVFGGVANIFSNFNKTDVDVDRIMGKWFQMYKAAINFDVFQTNMYCHVSYFYRNKVMGPKGFSVEEAYHVIGKNGPIETYKRDVHSTGPGEYWMYTEEYFYPRQFYILKVGPGEETGTASVDDGLSNNATDDANATLGLVRHLSQRKTPYEYLIATDANRLALMVYARDPNKFYETYDKELMKELQKGGFGGYVFWNQPVAIYQGPDCYYPNEKEVFARRALKAGGQRQAASAPVSIGQNPLSQSPALGSLLQQQQQQQQQQQLALQQQLLLQQQLKQPQQQSTAPAPAPVPLQALFG